MLATVLIVFGVVSIACAAPGEKVPCTVCGYLIDKDSALRADYEGTTYYFCEAGCKAYFLQNPAVFAAGTDMDPVCGMTVKKDGSVSAVQNGRQIHFCSEDCKAKYLANPGDYEINYDVVANEVKPVKDLGYTMTFEGRPYYFASKENMAAFQKNPDAYIYAECPVSGKVFLRQEAGAKKLYKGATYYFCCKGCLKKFESDPAKYMGPATGEAEKGCAHTDAKPADCKKAMEAGQCPHSKPKKT